MEETCAMTERMRFMTAVEQEDEAFAAVCRRFGVSRKTGYKWLERYQAEGLGLSIARGRRSPSGGGAGGHCRAVLGGSACASHLGTDEGASLA